MSEPATISAATTEMPPMMDRPHHDIGAVQLGCR